MTLSLTLDQIQALNPCKRDGERVVAALTATGATEWTAAEARAAGCTLEDIIWAASAMAHKDREIERRLRHWMADCAAHVLHIYEDAYPSDGRVRAAIQAARDYAEGNITGDAWAAWAAAWDAAWAARDAAGDAARAAAWAAAGDAAWDAAWAARDAAGDAARAAERTWQFDRLCDWLSDNPPEPLPLPHQKDLETDDER